MEVEAGLGEAGRTIEYPAVEPVVSASGLEESRPSWDFSAARGNPLHGGRLLLAVVSAPRALTQLWVRLSITATLDHHGVRLPAWLGGRPGRQGEAVETELWTSA
jgi:hypothetical protein